ncbi:hypothetical protein OS493_001748 [Desmophyllum pertusum]|uniref:Uncharacterized protein n=1 Tax=Desmophyllum pertusum TaxID=174260 RepID=A0A9W9Z600_9CNID|nr:hypothetical protein OS493_001748 [Desmophyllum pertusum]
MKEVSDLKNFLEGTVSTVQASLNSQKATNGPEGTVSKPDTQVRADDLQSTWAHFNQPSKRLTKTSTLISILALPLKWKTYMLLEISKLPHLGKTRHLDSKQAQMMREWAVLHGKCVRQRTTTPRKRLNLFQNHMPDAPIIAHEEEEREEEEQEQEENGVTSNLQEDEYDTDSEREHAVDDDNDDDTLTFMRAVTTLSGRAVRVRFLS